MKNYRLAGAAAIALCLTFSFGCNIYIQQQKQKNSHDSYNIPLTPAPKTEDPTAGINEDFTVNEKFSSHFPLIVMDMGGEEPPITTRLLLEERRYITLDNIQPDIPGSFFLIDNASGINRPWDTPVAESQMMIKRRGNSSMAYPKAQYHLNLITESGQNNDLNLLNMGEEHDWILNGSMADKSMMRNYISYRTCSEILPNTPDSRYCELLIKNGDIYIYQGVYLLIESVKQGIDRVNISNFQASQPFNSFILRRDRYDESDDRLLDINPNLNGIQNHTSFFYRLYPTRTDTTEEQNIYIQNTISKIEEVLYSDRPRLFATYKDYIDIDSFVDYFVLNEYFANYDAGQYSTYMYQEVGGKLKIGPVWDFDGAMDNSRQEELKPDVTAIQVKPWFECLIKDKYFLRKVENRYAELRRGILSDDSMMKFIDELEAYIGGAKEREWLRWNLLYTQKNSFSLKGFPDETGFTPERESNQYEQEVYRLKTVLRKHGAAVPGRLKLLEQSTTYDSGAKSYQGIFLLLATAAFFIPVYYVNRR